MTADLSNITVKKNEKPKLVITGLAAVVKRIRRRNLRIAALKDSNEEDKAKLIERARSERIEEEKAGNFYKNCVIDGGNQDPARITFTNKFRPVDPCHEETLRKVLGGFFEDLFEVKTTIKPHDQDAIERIRELLGEEEFHRLFDVSVTIATKSDFMEQRAKLRPMIDKLGKKTNQVLDDLIKELQHKPLFSTK